MKFTDLFVRRPVLALVVSTLILLFGFYAFDKLPIRQYPLLESSTISISTEYPGASAELMQGFVTQPIAQAVSAVEGVDYLSSSTVQGRSTVTLRMELNRDSTQALTEVMGGQPLFMFYHPAAVLPHLKSGKLRALGSSSARRSAAAPDVPTLMELGVADFDLVAWFMLYAPAATPPAVLAKLREAAAQALATPGLKERLATQGVETRPMGAAEMAEFSAREVTKWAEAVKKSGALVD